MKRIEIFSLANGRCFYCGVPLALDGEFKDGRDWLVPVARPEMSKDHKHPTQRGGSDDAENLIAACGRCNSSKSLSTVEEYRLRLAIGEGVMPRFAGEPPRAIRDYLFVVSASRARDLIVHNFPDAYGHRKYGGWGR